MYSVLIRPWDPSLPAPAARVAQSPRAALVRREHGLRLYWIRVAGKRVSARWQRV